jgi:hypothetical protein
VAAHQFGKNFGGQSAGRVRVGTYERRSPARYGVAMKRDYWDSKTFKLRNQIVKSTEMRRKNCDGVDIVLKQSLQYFPLSLWIVLFGSQVLSLHPERTEVEGRFPDAFPEPVEKVLGLDGRNYGDGDFLAHDTSPSFVIEPGNEFFSAE